MGYSPVVTSSYQAQRTARNIRLDLLLDSSAVARAVVLGNVLVVPDLALPAVLGEVLHELLVFVRQIDAGHIRDEKVGDENARDTAYCRDDKRPPVSPRPSARQLTVPPACNLLRTASSA